MTHLRLLLIGQALGGGGAETRFRLLSEHIFEGKADVAVLSARSDQGALPVIDLGWRGRYSYANVLIKFRALLVRNDYDVVMSFGMFPNILAAIAVHTCRNRPRLIINEISRPTMQAKAGGWLRGRIHLFLQRSFYPLCDRLTANSIDGLVEACALARIPVEHGCRVPNVMDRKVLEVRAADLIDAPTEGQYFVCVSRLDRMKRLDTVIEAWGRLHDKVDACLVIVGDGEVRQELEDQIASNDLAGKVFLVGSSANPMPLLARARGFILASEYEGFSNSVLEAMCLDVPVITSLCSTDAVQMCRQGAALGFDVGNSGQLADRVQELMASEELAADMVARARSYREPHLLPEAILAYERLINECVGMKINHRSGRCAA